MEVEQRRQQLLASWRNDVGRDKKDIIEYVGHPAMGSGAIDDNNLYTKKQASNDLGPTYQKAADITTASAGGVSAGGVSAGGVSAGGVSAGGVSAGGVSAGGVSAGGVSAGTTAASDSEDSQSMDPDNDASLAVGSSSQPEKHTIPKFKKRKSLAPTNLQQADNNIVALQLVGISDTQAKDVEQILQIKLLVKFFLHKELSDFNGGKYQKKEYLQTILKSLVSKDAAQILNDLTEYLKTHNNAAGQGNILSSIIFVTYKNQAGEENTTPYNLQSNSSNTYNILSHNNEEFRELMQAAHGMDGHSAMHDFHTETALILNLKSEIPKIRTTFNNRVTRISICIDSRLSGCNSCVDKMQAVRNVIAKDPAMSSSASSSSSGSLPNIRCSIAFNSSRKFTGGMGHMTHAATNDDDEASASATAAVRKKAKPASQEQNLFSVAASPMMVAGEARFKDPRKTHPDRSPDKKKWLDKIILYSSEFISGSRDSQSFASTVPNILNSPEAKRDIDLVFNKIIDGLFPEIVAASNDRDDDNANNAYVNALAQSSSSSSASKSPMGK